MQDGLGAMELNLERRDGFLPLLWALRNILGDEHVAPAYVLNTFQIPGQKQQGVKKLYMDLRIMLIRKPIDCDVI